MIPLRDSVATRRPPVVTVALIATCVLVFLYELTLRRGRGLTLFVDQWGAVPRLVLGALGDGGTQVPRTALLTLVTSQFLHAGFLHIAGNMLFLWAFGRAVEDRLGHATYLLFYLLGGALAGLAQCLASGPADTTPLVGASGAIATVLGAYFVMYPKAWVRVLVPVLFFFWTFDLPAVLVLAFWFLTQFFSSVGAITQTTQSTQDVAVWAHVAGFVLGALFTPLLPKRPPLEGSLSNVGGSNVPGPARLVASIGNLVALLLLVRLAVRLFPLGGLSPLVGALVTPILAATAPIVAPFARVLPDVLVAGRLLETPTLAALVVVYLVTGFVSQRLTRA